jgi:hypothetical protein
MSNVTKIIHEQVAQTVASATNGSAKPLEQTLNKLPELLEPIAKQITQQYAIIEDCSQKLTQKNNELKTQVNKSKNDITIIKAAIENTHVDTKTLGPDQARSLLETTPTPGQGH